MVWPTGTTSPAWDLTPARTPSAVASTSTTALSVSTSRRMSPLLTESPSFFTHETIFPVSCAISSAGMTTLVAIGFKENAGAGFSRLSAERLCRLAHGLRGRHRRIFKRRRKRNGNVHRSDSFHGRLEIVERARRDHRRDLGRHSISFVTFVDNDYAR